MEEFQISSLKDRRNFPVIRLKRPTIKTKKGTTR